MCGSDATNGNRRLVFVDGAQVSLMRVVRHDAVELRVGDGRDGRHDDGRERVEVPPLYLTRTWIIKTLDDAEAWFLRAHWLLLLSAQPRLSKKSEHFNCLIIFFLFFRLSS